MITYLANPQTQQQGDAVEAMPVLVSFASWASWMERYQHSWGPLLLDSGAYSELTGAASIDLGAYREFTQRWAWRAEAFAGLDDIGGDWRRSLANYKAVSGSFPTYHDTDPPELLPDLVSLAQERSGWLGIGLKPPRQGKKGWLERTLERIPSDIHVHGWALRTYRNDVAGFASMDSTNWWRDAMKIRRSLPWLTYGEALRLMVKKYQRERLVVLPSVAAQLEIFP